MEWLTNYFLVNDDTFFMILWSLFLASLALLLFLRANKASGAGVFSVAPRIDDAFLPTIIKKPHSPIVYVACKKCGSHAVKIANRVECLSVTCRFNTK